MTATKIVELDDGRVLLETFDYRSEFSFDDFAAWIAQALAIEANGARIGEDTEPFQFDFLGSTFRAAYDDEHGCVVEAPATLRRELEELQKKLAE
jgi:hypothetical protein